MKLSRSLRYAALAALVFAPAACDESDTTTAPGAIANIVVEAPDSAQSGQSFGVDIRATNAGIAGIHNGRVNVTLASPLTVVSLDPSPGTSATFSNGAAVSTVNWVLNTLDSNSQSTLHIVASGTLPAAEAARTVRIEATLTADGIGAGDAVAHDDVQLTR